MTRLRQPILVAALLVLAPLTGCEHRFFSASGSVSSDGGGLGEWKSTPKGCSRDPLDGAPAGHSATVATFLWQDPRIEARIGNIHSVPIPDAPLRLEVRRAATGLNAILYTVKVNGPIALDQTVCSEIRLDSHEISPQIAGGHPALAGRLHLDCHLRDSHLKANVRFSGCEF
jgi:hypothetical protein